MAAPSLYAFRDQNDAGRILNRLKRIEGSIPHQRGGILQKTGGGRTTVPNNLFNSPQISLASPSISKIGSLSPSFNNMGFGIICIDTIARIFWDGITAGSQIIVIHRADGSEQVIPPGFVDIQGLTANTTYYALPFWSPYNQCTIGWVQGTVGDPPILFTSVTDLINSWQQNQAWREPLTATYLTFTTSSTSNPIYPPITAPGGGPLHCVMLGTEIRTIDDEDYETKHYHEDHWWYIRDSERHWVHVTPNHRFYDAEGYPKQAQDFEIGDFIVHRDGNFEVVESGGLARSCTKIEVRMKRKHLFWANGFLSHNIKMSPL